MILLRILDLAVPASTVLISTTWEVGEGDEYSLESRLEIAKEDTVNTRVKVFDIPVTKGVKYWARAQQVFNTGFTTFSDVEVFVGGDVNDIEMSIDTPSVIDVPRFESDFDFNMHPVMYFNLYGGTYNAVGTSKLSKSTWCFTGLDNKIEMLLNTNSKNTMLIDKALDTNRIYNLGLSFEGTNKDVSQFGTTTLYTSFDKRVRYKTPVTDHNNNQDLELEIETVPLLTSVLWVLYESGKEIWREIGNETLLIPAEHFKEAEYYILACTLTVDDKVGDVDFRYFLASPNIGVDEPIASSCDKGLPFSLGNSCLGGPVYTAPSVEECDEGFAIEFGDDVFADCPETSTTCESGFEFEFGGCFSDEEETGIKNGDCDSGFTVEFGDDVFDNCDER